MAEAGDMIEAQLARFAGEIDRKVFDVFTRNHIRRFRLQRFPVFQGQLKRPAFRAGEFQVVVIISVDGSICFIRQHSRSPVSLQRHRLPVP